MDVCKPKIINILIILCYGLCFIGMVGAPSLTYLGFLRMSRLFFAIALVLGIIANTLFIFYREYFSNRLKIQMWCIYSFLLLFLSVVIFSPYRTGKIYASYLVVLESLFCIEGFVSFLILINRRELIKKIISFVTDNKMIFVIIVVWVVGVAETLRNWIIWDSAVFYKPIVFLKSFSLSPNEVVMFKQGGHMSYAYSIVSLVGELLLPDHGKGVKIVDVLLLLSTFIACYLILRRLYSTQSNYLNKALMLILAVTPVIMGPLHEINVDIPLLCFFVLFYCCYVYHYHLLELIFGILLVFSKENGVIILAFFCFGYLLEALIKGIKNKKIWKKLTEKSVITNCVMMYIPLFFALLYYRVDQSGWNKNLASNTKERTFNTFGLNWIYIISRFKTIFLMNFQWIITLLIIAGTICIIIRLKNKNKIVFPEELFPMHFAYLGFLVMQFFYITYSLPRYGMIHYFYSVLILGWIFVNIGAVAVKKIITTMMIMVLIIQNYYTLDPISRMIFKGIDIGETQIISGCEIISPDGYSAETGGEAAVGDLSIYDNYNRQYSYKNKLLESALKQIDYDKNDLLLFPEMFGEGWSERSFWGESSDMTYYNPENFRVYQMFNYETFPFDDTEKINCQFMNKGDKIEQFSEYDHIYYFEFPYRKGFEASKLVGEYGVKDRETITYRGWETTIVKIK